MKLAWLLGEIRYLPSRLCGRGPRVDQKRPFFLRLTEGTTLHPAKLTSLRAANGSDLAAWLMAGIKMPPGNGVPLTPSTIPDGNWRIVGPR
jgi:hypothetical protein